MREPTDQPFSQRVPRDRSLALVLIGIAVLMPPMIAIPMLDVKLAGVPLSLLYILAVWAILIVGAACLARPLRDSDPSLNISEADGLDD